jgi:hypothetical protein
MTRINPSKEQITGIVIEASSSREKEDFNISTIGDEG